VQSARETEGESDIYRERESERERERKQVRAALTDTEANKQLKRQSVEMC